MSNRVSKSLTFPQGIRGKVRDKIKTKSIRMALSLFLLFYGASHLFANYYFSGNGLDFWLLPMALNFSCLAFLFWPHKYHREKTHALLFITAVLFIYLSAALTLLTALYLAAASFNVSLGFCFVSPLILLAILL